MPSEATTVLLRGGRLATAAQGDADSLLIEAGRIVWIGVAKDAPRADRTIDLQGSRVVAGITYQFALAVIRQTGTGDVANLYCENLVQLVNRNGTAPGPLDAPADAGPHGRGD